MKAVQIYGWGGPVKVEEIPEPTIGDMEVLVRVKATLLSNTDPDYLEGKTATFLDPDHFVFPMTPTSRGSGVVERIGSRVTSLVPGDRVTVNQIVNCKQCAECYAGRDNHCPNIIILGISSTHHGVMAEMVKVPEWTVHKLDESISFCTAGLLSDTALVIHALDRAAPIPGFTAAIFGCGKVGSVGIPVVRAYGCSQLICSDTRSDALALAQRLGVNAAIDASQTDVVKAIKDLTSGRGVDVALVTATSTEAFQHALYSVAAGGTVVLLGIPPEKRVALVFENYNRDAILRELTIKTTFGKTQQDYQRAVTLVTNKQIDLSPFGFEEYDSLDKYEEAAKRVYTLPGADKRVVVLPCGRD